MRHRQFAKLFHRLQRFAVDKHQSAAPEKRPHVDGSGIEPYPTAHDAGQGKGLVGIGEHRAIEFVAPGGNGWLRRTALAPKTGETNWNGLLHPTVFQDFRAFDENLCPRSGLVTDHLRGTRTSARRAYALAVGARGDHHAFAGLEHLGSLVDGAEWPPLRARSVVVGLGMADCRRSRSWRISAAVPRRNTRCRRADANPPKRRWGWLGPRRWRHRSEHGPARFHPERPSRPCPPHTAESDGDRWIGWEFHSLTRRNLREIAFVLISYPSHKVEMNAHQTH